VGGGANSSHDFGGSGERGGELDLGEVADPASLQANVFFKKKHVFLWHTTPRSVCELARQRQRIPKP